MPHKIENGNNMPVQAPLIPDPFVPYECPDNVTLSVLCRAAPELLERYLTPVPYAPKSGLFVVYASDFSNCTKCRFMDGGIIVPVDYEGRAGATYLFEYEDNDSAIAAGRDLWGYPKKYADITLDTNGDIAHVRITRKGTDILTIDADFSVEAPFEMPQLAPHFNLHVQPGPDGKVLSRRIIERDTSPDFQLKSTRMGRAEVALASIENDPLGEFSPLEILGAQLVTGNFFATEGNGWGRTIAHLD